MEIARRVSILLALALALAARGEVHEVAQSGFLIKQEVTFSAPPEKVYAAMLDGVGKWWNPDHTYSGDAKNLSIEPRAGGCFCEKLADGGSVEHLRVVFLQPNKVLRMSGALGPLQASGLAGSMTFRLSGGAAFTKLDFSYVVGGYVQGGFEKMAPAVNGMLGEQLGRLKRYIETGRPE